MKSNHAVVLVAFIWFIAGAFYYPKWNKPFSEASISWDVSGYYHYLPAIFIYKDIRQQNWMNEINQKYLPSPAYDQAFGHHDSGNKVNKYAIGQAVLYSPFFLVAHLYTKATGTFPADGYSKPYQIAIWFGSLLFSILGLFLLRKILLHYFTDVNVGWTLLALGIGTHWFEYASISNGMNHTWLFTLLCGLILFTIRFYKKTDWPSALGIGLCLGLGILTRPTEITWVFVPLLWGISTLRTRFDFLQLHWKKCLLAALLTGLIVGVQLIYWKYASGEWIVYSYGEQGFNWLNPKIWRGLMGVNVGWWLYTPLMLLAMFGWHLLYRNNKPIFWPTFISSLLAIYITLSWAHWESGGGLGQRNLIQIYPLLAFPLISVITWFNRTKRGSLIWLIILLANIYYTGWWMHQAHKGGFFKAGQMTTPYFYRVVARLHPDPDHQKLLDTDEYFSGHPRNSKLIYENEFESDSLLPCTVALADSTKAACLNASVQLLGPLVIPTDQSCNEWLRFEAYFNVQSREWDVWKYAQWIVQFYQGEKVIKTNLTRVHRFLPVDYIDTRIHFDVKTPEEDYDKCTMSIWNAESTNTLLVDHLKVTCFKD